MTCSFDRRPAAASPATATLLALSLALSLAACAPRQSPEALIAAAQRHLAENNPSAAQIELRNAIQAAPRNGPAHLLLGGTLLRLGNPVAAEAVLRQALDLAQPADAVLPALTQAVLRQGQAKRLIDEFGSSTLQDPAAEAAVRAAVGHAWLLREEVKPAAQAFDAALAAQPGNASALLGRARLAAHDNRVDDALALVDSALKSAPRLAEAHAFRSQLLVARGQRAEALAAAQQSLAADATYLPGRLGLVSILIDAKDYEKARTTLESAGPAVQDPRSQTMLALLALRQDDLPKAKAAVAAALKAAPEFGPALALAGEIELRSDNYAMAEQYFGMATRVQPTPEGRRMLAALQLRQGRAAKALETLEPLLQDTTQPRSAALLLLAGEATLANGDLRRAGEYFEAAKSAQATEAPARTRLGQLALRSGDFVRGEHELLLASERGRTTEPDVLLVSWHLRRGEPAKALAAARAVIAKQPQNPLGHVLAGTALAQQGNPAEARLAFEAALRIKPDHLPALNALAELDLAEGRPENALQRFDALLAKTPDSAPLLVAAAALQERAGRGEAALASLRHAVAANPRAHEPVVALVQYQLRQKNPAGALEVAQEAVRREPDRTELALVLAAAQEASGAPKDAIRTLTALTVKEPKALAPWLQLAQVHARQRDTERAAGILARVLEKAPDNEVAARDLAGVYLQAGKIDQALKVARERQARRPDSSLGLALEGDVLALSRRWSEAERAYRGALKIDPEAGDAAAQVYRMLIALARTKDAHGFAADWITRHPADTTMRLLVADAALRSRNLPAAIEQYEAVLKLDPHQALVLSSLAGALVQARDPRALGIAERARALQPNDPDVLAALGLMHLQVGDPKKGLELLQRVRTLAPDRPDLRLSYARGLLRNGRTQEGKAELRELAEAKIDFPGKDDIAPLLATP